MQSILAISLLCATLVAANQASKICKDYTIPLTVTSGNYQWGLPDLTTNYDATTFTTNLARWDANVTLNPISGYGNATTDYKISGTFCSPVKGGSGTVLLASHGFGFDRSYWDPDFQPSNYSFVDFAVARGYSVFFYDRLGVSKSSVASGYVSQVSIQVAALEQLVTLIRGGEFSAPAKKVVLVGHSFGSVVSNSLLGSNPDLVDGAVLTGIGYAVPDTSVTVEGWQPRLARLQSPGRWRQLDGGYITWVDIFANINTFFKFPFYDAKTVEYADENKQPFALMEVITLSIADLHAPKFVDPVLVISGEYDMIFCNGYCPGILEPGARAAFPASDNLVVYAQPGSGHAINFSLNATGAFEVIANFLESSGL